MPRKINVYYLGKVYFEFRCKVVYKYLNLNGVEYWCWVCVKILRFLVAS